MKEKSDLKNIKVKDTKISIAEVVSIILDPIFLGLLILIASIIKSSMLQNVMIGWIIGILILNALIPALFYWFFTSQGYVFDAPLTNKNAQKQRIIIFMIYLAVIALELIVLVSTHIYQPLFAVLVGATITIIIGSIISYFYKVSVHASMATLFVSMIILLFGWGWWPVILFIPVIFWSRLMLHRHTISQLLTGFVLSLVIVLMTFSYFGLL